jgi:hypothetical protein
MNPLRYRIDALPAHPLRARAQFPALNAMPPGTTSTPPAIPSRPLATASPPLAITVMPLAIPAMPRGQPATHDFLIPNPRPDLTPVAPADAAAS